MHCRGLARRLSFILRPEHDEYHLELRSRPYRVRLIRRQSDRLALPHRVALACYLDISFAIEDYDEGVERRRVLT